MLVDATLLRGGVYPSTAWDSPVVGFGLPRGPLISTFVVGISFATPLTATWGRSMNFRETSGGMAIAAAPTRDWVGEVVEKDWVRGSCEKAGARKIGKEPWRRGPRVSCRRQLCVRNPDMAYGIELHLEVSTAQADLRFQLILSRLAAGPIRLVWHVTVYRAVPFQVRSTTWTGIEYDRA